MNRRWALPVSLLCWMLAFPVVTVSLRLLADRGHRWAEAAHSGNWVLSAMAAGAALIYWFFVPSAPSIGRRTLDLAGYLLALCAAAFCAYWLGFVVQVSLFGL